MSGMTFGRCLLRRLGILLLLLHAPHAVAAQDLPDGEALYRQRCARCHEGQMPTIMLQGSIREIPADRILEAMAWAQDQEADVLALPELAITGYPPEDLLLRDSFIAANLATLREVAAAIKLSRHYF